VKEWLRKQWAVIWRVIGGVSLRVKIMGIALAMIALLGLVITYQVRRTMVRVLTEEMEQRGRSVALGLAARSADLLATDDLDSLRELTRDTVTRNEDVHYALVLDPQGNVISHFFDDRFPTDPLEATPIPADQPTHLDTLQTAEGSGQDVTVPISEGRAGTARVGISVSRLDRTLAGVTRQILLTTVLVSLLGVVISTALTWFFTHPLLALAKATRQVVEEDLSHRLTPWADDEVGQLQASFNTMIEHLAQSRQEMEAYNRRLLRRNQELSVLNAISRAVAGSLGLAESLECALEQTIGMVSAVGGWVCLLGEDGFCQVCVSAGDPSQANSRLAYCQRCPVCQEAAQTRQPVIVNPLPSECFLCTAGASDGCVIAGHVAVPLLVKEHVVGLLNLVYEEPDCLSLETANLDLLAAIGRQLGVAIENARLWEQVRHKEALRGQLLRKIITAQEEERRRIARELHDEAGQALTSLLIGLRAMEKSASLKEVHTLAADLRKTVAQTLDQVHDLALELRPSVLDDLGLVPALARYIESCPGRFGFQADFVTVGMNGRRLPREAETVLYRIVQEALTNVARHTSANQVSVLLQRRRDAVVLVIEDDGEGFDVAQVMASAERRERLGLYGMEERASLVDGHLTVESSPETGTTITVEIPLGGVWQAAHGVKRPVDDNPSAS
jgi:signal transduction histidine kinase